MSACLFSNQGHSPHQIIQRLVTVQIVLWQPVIETNSQQMEQAMRHESGCLNGCLIFLARFLFCLKLPVSFDKKSALFSNKVQSKPACIKVQRTKTFGHCVDGKSLSNLIYKNLLRSLPTPAIHPKCCCLLPKGGQTFLPHFLKDPTHTSQ